MSDTLTYEPEPQLQASAPPRPPRKPPRTAVACEEPPERDMNVVWTSNINVPVDFNT